MTRHFVRSASRTLALLACIVLATAGLDAQADGAAEQRGSISPEPHAESELAVGGAVLAGQPITFEIADTPATMQHGLMFRESMPEHHGMLFVWPSEGPRTMWMRNTPLPLSVAFVNAEGRILNIADMQPRTFDLHSSEGAARYALEMHQGWFERHSVRAGDTLDFLAR